MLNAYAHFKVLSDREYNFSCVFCGYHLPILIADNNRKVTFRHKSDGEDVTNTPEHQNDFVDCDEFWMKVEATILSKRFVGREYKELWLTRNIRKFIEILGNLKWTAERSLKTDCWTDTLRAQQKIFTGLLFDSMVTQKVPN